MPSKIEDEDKLIGSIEDFKIYVRVIKAKKRGKDRLCFRIIQEEPKAWRMTETVGHVSTGYIWFEKEREKVS